MMWGWIYELGRAVTHFVRGLWREKRTAEEEERLRLQRERKEADAAARKWRANEVETTLLLEKSRENRIAFERQVEDLTAQIEGLTDER